MKWVSFFGYLDKRWKRLARVLSFVLLPVTGLLSIYFDNSINNEEDAFMFGCIIHIFLVVPLISYTLKPFVVKEKS